MTMIEDPAPIVLESPSSDDLRALMFPPEVKGEPEPSKETPGKPEPKTEVAKPDAGTGEVKKEIAEDPEVTEEDDDKDLPKWAKDRIAKEVAREAKATRAITEAVSRRKAAEHEAAKLNGTTGADPEKTPNADENAEPQAPDLDTFEGTTQEFKAAQSKYVTDYRAWMQKQTETTVEAQFAKREAARSANERMAGAIKEHGEGFHDKLDAVVDATPALMQRTIGVMDNWSKVTVYLAEHPAELKALADEFGTHPADSPGALRAMAKLNRLEDKVTAQPAVTEAPGKKLPPPPLKKVGAEPTGDSEVDLNSMSAAQLANYMRKNGHV